MSFFIGGSSEDEYAATRCRRSHLGGSKNPAVGLPLAGNGCIPVVPFIIINVFFASDNDIVTNNERILCKNTDENHAMNADEIREELENAEST